MIQGLIFQTALPLVGLFLWGTGRVAAQQEALVYLPFGWNGVRNEPMSASILGTDAAATQTTWGLLERPLDREVGPATIIHGPAPDQASLIYVAPLLDGLPTQTITGDCVIATPIAVCSMNVELPTTRVTVRPTVTGRIFTTGAEGDVRETEPPAVRNGSRTTQELPRVKMWVMAALGYGVAVLLWG